MSYAELESSRSLGRPIELYKFTGAPATPIGVDQGDGVGTFAYTNSTSEVVHDSITYEPIPISRTNITTNSSTDKAKLSVSMDRNHDLCNLYVGGLPPQGINLTIFQGHVGQPTSEFVVTWSGRAVGLDYNGSEVTFTCETVFTSMRRSGNNRPYILGCPLLLYGPDCRASKSAATVTTTIQSISDQVLVLNNSWTTKTKTDFLNGMLSWEDANNLIQTRRISAVGDGNHIEVQGSISGLLAGDTINLILGCDHTMSNCENVHNNIQNFGGQPYIPTLNPISSINLFG